MERSTVWTHGVQQFASVFCQVYRGGRRRVRADVRIRENEKAVHQIDFHLPRGAETLFLHVKIQNLDDEKKSMYWWTNIAIQAEEKLRVFSGTDEVMYLHPESISDNVNPVRVFGHTRLPDLPTLPGKDSSYPSNADYSNEFFFQNPEKPEACWSAAAYGDGRVVFEESTLPLRYRKMFCWGQTSGAAGAGVPIWHRGGGKLCGASGRIDADPTEWN